MLTFLIAGLAVRKQLLLISIFSYLYYLDFYTGMQASKKVSQVFQNPGGPSWNKFIQIAKSAAPVCWCRCPITVGRGLLSCSKPGSAPMRAAGSISASTMAKSVSAGQYHSQTNSGGFANRAVGVPPPMP